MVEKPNLGHARHLLPIELLEGADESQLRLRCSRADVGRAELFVDIERLPPDPAMTWSFADDMLGWPIGYSNFPHILVEHERVPPGETAVHRDAPVQANHKDVGRVAAFDIESSSERVVAVVVRGGHFWRRNEVVIPAAAIHRIDERGVKVSPRSGRAARQLATTPSANV